MSHVLHPVQMVVISITKDSVVSAKKQYPCLRLPFSGVFFVAKLSAHAL